MKKLMAVVMVLLLICGGVHAEEPTSCLVDGIETSGVTFVIDDVRLEMDRLIISVRQLPNDDGTTLIDNQTECAPDDPDRLREIERAGQYGGKVLGTLCDILALTDEKGNSLLNEYAISSERSGASLTDEFCVYLPADLTAKELRAEFVFGVNENLSSRFENPGRVTLTVPMYAD